VLRAVLDDLVAWVQNDDGAVVELEVHGTISGGSTTRWATGAKPGVLNPLCEVSDRRP
jgi:hypothetical protein